MLIHCLAVFSLIHVVGCTQCDATNLLGPLQEYCCRRIRNREDRSGLELKYRKDLQEIFQCPDLTKLKICHVEHKCALTPKPALLKKAVNAESSANTLKIIDDLSEFTEAKNYKFLVANDRDIRKKGQEKDFAQLFYRKSIMYTVSSSVSVVEGKVNATVTVSRTSLGDGFPTVCPVVKEARYFGCDYEEMEGTRKLICVFESEPTRPPNSCWGGYGKGYRN